MKVICVTKQICKFASENNLKVGFYGGKDTTLNKCIDNLKGEFEDLKFIEAMNRIRATAERLKVPGGVHLIEPNPAELVRLVEEGNEFIAYSLDIRMVDVSCRTGLAAIKKVRK